MLMSGQAGSQQPAAALNSPPCAPPCSACLLAPHAPLLLSPLAAHRVPSNRSRLPFSLARLISPCSQTAELAMPAAACPNNNTLFCVRAGGGLLRLWGVPPHPTAAPGSLPAPPPQHPTCLFSPSGDAPASCNFDRCFLLCFAYLAPAPLRCILRPHPDTRLFKWCKQSTLQMDAADPRWQTPAEHYKIIEFKWAVGSNWVQGAAIPGSATAPRFLAPRSPEIVMMRLSRGWLTPVAAGNFEGCGWKTCWPLRGELWTVDGVSQSVGTQIQ